MYSAASFADLSEKGNQTEYLMNFFLHLFIKVKVFTQDIER